MSIPNIIAGPVLNNTNHWCLFFANLLTRELTFIDPIMTSDDEFDDAFDNFIINIRNSFECFKGKDFKKLKGKHQTQKDNHNCGVFVCHFFDLLLNGEITNFENEINPHDFRETTINKISLLSKSTRCVVCQKAAPFIKNLFSESAFVTFENCSHLIHKKCLFENNSIGRCLSCKIIQDVKNVINI